MLCVRELRSLPLSERLRQCPNVLIGTKDPGADRDAERELHEGQSRDHCEEGPTAAMASGQDHYAVRVEDVHNRGHDSGQGRLYRRRLEKES